ncbi:MAG: hypothetical protein K8T20_13680 [Planctomycetes bacterium]|nr:hypothetical protein [Planctomycetota bacterium]
MRRFQFHPGRRLRLALSFPPGFLLAAAMGLAVLAAAGVAFFLLLVAA